MLHGDADSGSGDIIITTDIGKLQLVEMSLTISWR